MMIIYLDVLNISNALVIALSSNVVLQQKLTPSRSRCCIIFTNDTINKLLVLQVHQDFIIIPQLHQDYIIP